MSDWHHGRIRAMNQVRARMEDIVNRQLAKIGMGRVPISLETLREDLNGQFDSRSGKIVLRSALLSPSRARVLGEVLYHEARHAEQFHRMVGRGNSSPEAVFGEAMHRSIEGAGSAYRGDVFQAMEDDPAIGSPADQRYRALPEEEDAYKTGYAAMDCLQAPS